MTGTVKPHAADMSASAHVTTATPSSPSSSTLPSVPWGVLWVSLLAFPVSYGLSLTAAMDDSRLVLLAGILFCSAILPSTYLLVVRGQPQGPSGYFYLFAMFAFTSIIDLILALTIDGYTNVLLFYLKQGEIYLSTAHGLWINAWDGTFHYACYLFLTGCMLRVGHRYSDRVFRLVGLVWAGSILNSMIVLFVGSAVGIYAAHIKPSYMLNIPYGLVPAIFLWRIWKARPTSQEKEASAKQQPIWLRPFDLFLVVMCFLSSCVCILRLLVVVRSRMPFAEWYASEVEQHLHDPAAYPTIQMITYAFYFTPFLMAACVQLWQGWPAEGVVDSTFRDCTLLAVGALLQGTFSYMGAALHGAGAFPTEDWIPQAADKNSLLWFAAINLLLLAVPILLAIRMQMGIVPTTNKTLAAKQK